MMDGTVAAPAEKKRSTTGYHVHPVTQVSWWLSFFSMLLLIEGVTRINLVASTHSGQWDGSSSVFPPIVLLLAALVEVIFGALGLAVGIMSGLYGKGSGVLTVVLIFTQLLGLFTWVVWTTAFPAFNQAKGNISYGGSLTKSESRGLTTMGILGHEAYATALQLGAFFFALALYRMQTGSGEVYNRAVYATHLMFYSFLVFMAGATQLVFGCILRHNIGHGRYAFPFIAGPYIAYFSELNITVGVVLILLGIWGMAKGAGGRAAKGTIPIHGFDVPFAATFAFAFIFELCLHNMPQAGLGSLTTAGALLVGLMFALCFMPAYLAYAMDTNQTFPKSIEDDVTVAPTAATAAAAEPVPAATNAV